MGFLPKPRTRVLVCDWDGLAPADGSEPLTVTVRANMTWDEIASLPVPEIDGSTFRFTDPKALRDHIAPLVLGWNCERYDVAAGQVVPVLPPSEAGPDAFLAVDPLVVVWLGLTLRSMQLTPFGDGTKDDQKKDTERLEPTPLRAPAEDSSSPARPKKRRKNQTASA